jgi:hypothetical protein
LCNESFNKLTNALAKRITSFPPDINIDKDVILSDDNLLKLMREPLPLFVNEENELYYVDDDSERVVVDPRIEDNKIMNQHLNDVFSILPDVPFDLHCGGIKRKPQEVASAYMVAVVNSFLGNGYDDDINNVISNYNFSSFKNRYL